MPGRRRHLLFRPGGLAGLAASAAGCRRTPLKQPTDRAKAAKHSIWRPNLGNPARLSWGLPDVAFTQMAEDFRFAADHDCLGIYHLKERGLLDAMRQRLPGAGGAR